MTRGWTFAVVAIAILTTLWLTFRRADRAEDEDSPRQKADAVSVSRPPDRESGGMTSEPDPATRPGSGREAVVTPGDREAAAEAERSTVVVRVERFDGEPIAEAEVFVSRRADQAASDGEERLAPTDSRGQTVLSLSANDRAADILRLRARFRDLFQGPPVELRISSLVDSTIVLRMPPSGQIELHLRPAPGVDPATLEPTPAWISPLQGDRALGAQGMRIDDSRIAHSGPLPLGRRYRLAIDSPSMSRFVDGPTRAGEVVRVEFEIGADRVLLTGRILGADGTPSRSAVLRMSAGGSLGIRGVRCQSDGSFLLVLDAETDGKELILTIEDGGNGRPMAAAHARIPALAIGRNDLGIVRLAAVEPTARGIVVDERGSPVAGALVSLWTWVPPDSAAAEPRWFQTMRGTRTLADGTFVLEGPTPLGRLALGVAPYTGPGNGIVMPIDDPHEITAPADGLRLVLRESHPQRR